MRVHYFPYQGSYYLLSFCLFKVDPSLIRWECGVLDDSYLKTFAHISISLSCLFKESKVKVRDMGSYTQKKL